MTHLFLKINDTSLISHLCNSMPSTVTVTKRIRQRKQLTSLVHPVVFSWESIVLSSETIIFYGEGGRKKKRHHDVSKSTHSDCIKIK